MLRVADPRSAIWLDEPSQQTLAIIFLAKFITIHTALFSKHVFLQRREHVFSSLFEDLPFCFAARFLCCLHYAQIT